MNTENEEAPIVGAIEAPKTDQQTAASLPEDEPGCPLHADCAQTEFGEATGEPALALVSKILKRTHIGGATVYRFPTFAPESVAYHELVVFARDKRLPGALLRGHVLELGVDLTDPAMIAAYQARLDAIARSIPWRPLAVALAYSSIRIADEAGLGLRYQHQEDGRAT